MRSRRQFGPLMRLVNGNNVGKPGEDVAIHGRNTNRRFLLWTDVIDSTNNRPHAAPFGVCA